MEIEMRLNKNLAFLLLAVYLIFAGLAGLGTSFGVLNVIGAVCALAAGILFLIKR
jgi:hypothetical protein